MSPVPVPPDDELRAFLLGTLSAERVEAVRAWLDADPTRAERLNRLAPRDPLTTALADKTPVNSIPNDTIERVIRRASDALHPPAGPDDTPRRPPAAPWCSRAHRLPNRHRRGPLSAWASTGWSARSGAGAWAWCWK